MDLHLIHPTAWPRDVDSHPSCRWTLRVSGLFGLAVTASCGGANAKSGTEP